MQNSIIPCKISSLHAKYHHCMQNIIIPVETLESLHAKKFHFKRKFIIYSETVSESFCAKIWCIMWGILQINEFYNVNCEQDWAALMSQPYWVKVEVQIDVDVNLRLRLKWGWVEVEVEIEVEMRLIWSWVWVKFGLKLGLINDKDGLS